MQTPVCFIIFNRPDTTEIVFREIARAKPEKLFVVADGPRPEHPDDPEKCAAARAVIDRVNWKCEVSKNYSDVNLGCGRRPATGIHWVFEQVEEAIILEDDCLPHPTFFRFCEELLDRYRHDERIMHISGYNYQFKHRRDPFSYFFSYFNFSTGWASWRRAWQHHDMQMKHWPALRNTSWLLDIVEEPRAVEYWQWPYDRAYALGSNVGYWDHQWNFACWTQSGLTIRPTTNLVANIGYGHRDATHTSSSDPILGDVPAEEIAFPLEHPPYVIRNVESDRSFVREIILRELSRNRGYYTRIRRKCSAVIDRHPSLESLRLLHRWLRQNIQGRPETVKKSW